MTCGVDEIVVTKVTGKNILIISTRSRVLDPTPKGIHRTKVRQKEIG